MTLKAEHLSKNYGETRALDNVSFVLQEGVYGLLGPNGAGKSTLIQLITQNLKPDSGKIEVAGKSVAQTGNEYRDLLGYMPQEDTLYPYFTGLQFLCYIGSLKKMDPIKARKQSLMMLKELGLWEVRNRKIRTYSGGMKRRVMLAQALLNDPEILILDEPTTGMDPQQRINVRNLIGRLSVSKTVIISTHVVSDIEYIANRILILDRGKLIADQEPYALCKRLEGKVFSTTIPEDRLSEFANVGIITGIAREKDGVKIRLISDQFPGDAAIREKPTLDDVYQYIFRENL